MNKFFITFLLILLSVFIFADVPETINFQGALKDADGMPVNDTRIMIFRIYDDLEAGTLKWNETQLGVEIADGIFNVELGSVTSFGAGLFDDPELYITFYIGDEEMSPRQRILSVPYAYQAVEIDGVPLSGLVQQDMNEDVEIAGTMTAWAFEGDGSALTDVSALPDDDWDYNGDNIYRETGNIGIGTDTPSEKLTVAGNIQSNAKIIAGYGTVADPALGFGSEDSGFSSPISNELVAITDGTERIRIDNTGNVGIGTNSPTTTLEVNGPIKASTLSVTSGAEGVSVISAGWDGFDVYEAGTPSSSNPSALHNGFEVAGAEGNGLYVGQADEDGIFIQSAGNPSLTSSTSENNGIEVAGAEDSGFWVGRAEKHGFNVQYADTYGVNIHSSGSNAIQVVQTNGDGLNVQWADDDGVYVGAVDDDGVNVWRAGDDGFIVEEAGIPSTTTLSALHNGFEVAGAEGNGLYVGVADNDGVYIGSVSDDGFSVWYALGDGVYVLSADGDGVNVNTTDASGEYGINTPDKIYAGAGYYPTRSGSFVRNTGNTSLEPGDIVSLAGGYEERVLDEDGVPVFNVQKADRDNSKSVIGVVEYKVYIREETEEFEDGKTETRKSFRFAEGNAYTGDYLAIIVLGPADVKVNSSENFETGDLLTIGNDKGTKVRTTEVNGITIAENVGVLGKALEDSHGKDMIKVFVGSK